MKHVSSGIRPSSRLCITIMTIAILSLTSCSDDIDSETADEPVSTDLFAVKAGGSGLDYATDITVDATGNTYMTGQFSDNAMFGTQNLVSSGAENIFLAKYDSSGNALWVRQGGGEKHDEGRSVKTDMQGNVYVCGYFQGTAIFGATTLTSAGDLDVFVAKYDAGGTLLWAKRAGGEGYDRAYAMDIDASGNLYMIGQYSDLAFFSDSKVLYAGDKATGSFLVKYTAAGDVLWVRSAAGSNYSEGTSMVVNTAGESFVAGSFFESITFGETTLTSAGDIDMFVAKYDADGLPVWAKRAGGATNDTNRGIVTDAAGNIYLTGFFTGTATIGLLSLTSAGEEDIFLAKYNAAGDPLWAVKTGGTFMDRSYAVSLDMSGNVYLTGDFRGTVSFGSTTLTTIGGAEIFLAKYTSSGAVAWARKTGGIGEDGGYASRVDGKGNITLGGYFESVVTFGQTELTSSGDHDIFLWKMKPQE